MIIEATVMKQLVERLAPDQVDQRDGDDDEEQHGRAAAW